MRDPPGACREAAELLPQVRELVKQQARELDLLRVLWLEGRILVGLGKTEEAMAALEKVQREFITAHDLPYDAALSSLDLAVRGWAHHRGKLQPPRSAWPGSMPRKKIEREALAALRLFYEAAPAGARHRGTGAEGDREDRRGEPLSPPLLGGRKGESTPVTKEEG